jgi:hypothetical protein
MIRLMFLFIWILISSNTYAQFKEFKVYPNGLIYSEEVMQKLSTIADSLNLKFLSCDVSKVFYSQKQVVGHLIKLNSGDIKSAKKDLEGNIPFDEFCSKYPEAEIQKNILIIKRRYTTYEDKEIVEIKHFNLKSDYGFGITTNDLSFYDKDLSNNWFYDYNEKSQYIEESIKSFYFPEDFNSIVLPEKYSLLIGYADCLIDTTTTKFKDELKSGQVTLPRNWKSLSDKKKEKLLDEMRSTRVVGYCSQDDSPREHAVNIALLSAETYNWGVFLKAHLDIMNDRFERMSDGSYARAQRNTYIKELEELNMNVTDLMLGISFRFENPAKNHYFGSIGRVGRALSESKNRSGIEEAILSIIQDNQLDYYNRLVFYFLFRNYNYYMEDEVIKKDNNIKLKAAAMTLPDFFYKYLIEE